MGREGVRAPFIDARREAVRRPWAARSPYTSPTRSPPRRGAACSSTPCSP